MSGLRDRDALDLALLRIIAESLPEQIDAIALYRVLGEGQDRRCLQVVSQQSGQTSPQRMQSRPEWTALPLLQVHPLWHLALLSGEVQTSEELPHTTVFPMLGVTPVLLEISTQSALSPIDRHLLEGVFRLYCNVLSLLDYGEKDALTELLNRKTFDAAFFKAAQEQDQAHDKHLGQERRTRSTSDGAWLAVLDIDHFKRVNDNYGHLIGDEVLLLVARIMRSCFRYYDQLYRFGGEEFVILLRCDASDDAKAGLERLRTTIEGYRFPQVGNITVSIGMSDLTSNDIPSQAFGRADKAVYYAKTHGRNQVCSYRDLVAQGEIVEQVNEGMDVDLF
ncbi:GGDEF domain-containing protein [Curvibacter sp. CHRR-16]|uniref:GGDEF domain-containing protein n=1 Tax=Curvibacter sp. CHRR-16 TaxID=2835872 RepID=UPI0020239FB9|nr:GGDEF domain-containing protein [Curvibacter sp. CHRR-16]